MSRHYQWPVGIAAIAVSVWAASISPSAALLTLVGGWLATFADHLGETGA